MRLFYAGAKDQNALCARVESISNSPSRAQLNFMAAIVDDENIEQSNDIHADENRRLFDQMPMFEDAHVAVRNSRALYCNFAQLYRPTLVVLGVLRGGGDIDHKIGGPVAIPPQ
jgi:hypothetical protein